MNRFRISLLACALALPILSTEGSASADRLTIRVGEARVHIGNGPRVVKQRRRARVRRHRPATVSAHAHASVGISAGFSFGVGFSEPPPPPPPACDYNCAAVPAYYVEEPAPPPPMVVYPPVPHRRPNPARFAIGAFAGSMDTEGREAGSDLGLLGRFRLNRHFELEAEIAKSEIDGGERVDKRFGGALLYNVSPHDRWSLYGLVGAGYGRAEAGAGTLYADQGYGELGLGVRWKMGRHLHVIGDVRGGQRHTSGSVAKASTPVEMDFADDDEGYSRLRLGALLYF